MYDFTAQDVLDKVVEIAEERPDFIHGNVGDNCSYLGRVVGDETGQCCIMGQALQDLGVSQETLRKYEGTSIPEILVIMGIMDDFSDPLGDTLGTIQYLQDIGVPWGEAIGLVDGRV